MLSFFSSDACKSTPILVPIKIKMKLFKLILKSREWGDSLLLGRYVQTGKPESSAKGNTLQFPG